jgi:hypothetical protein
VGEDDLARRTPFAELVSDKLSTGCGFPKASDPPATPWNRAIWIPSPEQVYRLFFTGVEMAKRERWQGIPTELSLERFREFVLPYLSAGSRGSDTKLSPHALFSYMLKQQYLGCQCKELPIEKDVNGRQEIHYTRVWRAFRRWEADGCFDAIFDGTVLTLHRADLLDVSVIHGDGTTTAAKKGGDNIGFSGYKKVKGDKVVAFFDRNCNVIAPFISAPGNYNESPLVCDALPVVTRIADSIGVDLRGTAGSLGVRGPERYFRVCSLTRGGPVVWIVRLVQIGADGEAPFVDVMTINRPDDLDDIANLGLTVARRKAGAGRPPTGDRCRASQEPLGSAASVPKLQWRLSPKGLPEPCGRDASWPGHGASSSFSLYWV